MQPTAARADTLAEYLVSQLRLIDTINERISARFKLIDISLPHDDGASLAWLYDHGEVVERQETADAIHLKVRLDSANAARFLRRRH